MISTYLLPWWCIPLLILVISIYHDKKAYTSALLAALITFAVWVSTAIVKDNSALWKISETTGSILMGANKSIVFIVTGLTISIVSGLMASAGGQIRTMFAAERK
jgi:hypothetical protein